MVTVQAKAGKILDGLEDHTVTRLLLKAPPSGGASRGRFAPSNTRIFQEFNIFLKNACERLQIMKPFFALLHLNPIGTSSLWQQIVRV